MYKLLLLELLQFKYQTPLNHYIVLLLLLVIKNLMIRSYCWRHYLFESWSWKNQSDKEADVLSMLPCFHSAGRCYASYWGRQVIISHTQLQTLKATVKTDTARPAHCSSSTTNIMGISNHLLTVSKFLSTQSNASLAPLSDQKPTDRQVVGLRKECTAIMLLCGHGIKLTQNNSPIYHRSMELTSLNLNASNWIRLWLSGT